MNVENKPNWDQIVSNHGPRVFRVAFRILGSVQDAEDVSQEVFLEAYRLHWSGPVQSWVGLLVRLATLRSIDCRRRKRRTVEVAENELAIDSDPALNLCYSELAQRLQAAMNELSEQQATAFAMWHFEQMSRDSIASALGTSPEAVSTALCKARQRLSQSLMLSHKENRS